METIFENLNMALLAQKDLDAFIGEMYKHNTIPFCVISDEKQVGKYLELIKNERPVVMDDEPQIIVLVLDFKKNEINC